MTLIKNLKDLTMRTLLAARRFAQDQIADSDKPLTSAERRRVTLAQLQIQEERFRMKIIQIQAYRRELLAGIAR
jgi:hypothetical protein